MEVAIVWSPTALSCRHVGSHFSSLRCCQGFIDGKCKQGLAVAAAINMGSQTRHCLQRMCAESGLCPWCTQVYEVRGRGRGGAHGFWPKLWLVWVVARLGT